MVGVCMFVCIFIITLRKNYLTDFTEVLLKDGWYIQDPGVIIGLVQFAFFLNDNRLFDVIPIQSHKY